jgi:oligoendopeptidase F
MSGQPLTRAEIPAAYIWDLTSIYQDDTHWEAEYEHVAAVLPELEALRDSLGTSAARFLHALTFRDTIAAHIDRLMLYAELHRDEDTTQAEQQAHAERASQLQARFRTSTAFFRPEILALSESTLTQFLNDAPELELYRFFLNDLQRQQAHVQSTEIETVLAQAQLLTEIPLALFGAIKDADFVAPTIHDENGSEIAVTHSRYWALLRGIERHVRCAAHQTYIDQFQARQHSLAAALASAIKRDVFLARVRNYPSALHAALDADAIPVTVYDELINMVTQHVSLLHRYVQLRQRVLGVDTLHFYDLWAPLASSIPSIAYDQARKTLLQALTPLGAEYGAILRYGLLEGRWVDVYETTHKRSGAYSTGAFGVSPFIMLNWQHQLNDLYTLAHEAGHAMHTYFAATTQPYIYSEYNIFVAEVASICNEILLSQHLLTTSTERNIRLYVLSQQLQRIVELLFWQALFAEFDKAVHDHAEADQALTAAWFGTMTAHLLRKYYGNTVQFDDSASMIWALFPHFYLNFYVYKFATGMAAALALVQQVRSEGQPAVERYLTFLRSGSSKTAIDVLREAGIDMTTAQPVEQAMQAFADLLDQLDSVLDEGD